MTAAAGSPVVIFRITGIANANTATFGYLTAKFPEGRSKIAELAYFVRPTTMNSGSTDKTAPPTITAEVVPIRFVMIERRLPWWKPPLPGLYLVWNV